MTLRLREADGGVVLSVRAQPGATKNRVMSVYDGCLKIAVAAPPVDGKANAALTEYLAELFSLRRSQVKLVKGATSTAKAFLLRNVSIEHVTRRASELVR